MESITRTGIGALLQTNQLLGLPHIIGPNSTLNQKFQINQNIALAEDDIPTVKYFAIGNGGHTTDTGTDNIPLISPIKHKPRSAALYNHLPFILRDPANDLAPEERIKYRLRRQETHDGEAYIAYYLKAIDLSEVQSKLELRVVEDDVTTSSNFEHQISDLSPTPPEMPEGEILEGTGDYLAATAKFDFLMSLVDVEELRNVANIVYGDDRYAIISELAICSGVDRMVVGNFNGTSSSYTDAVGVQVVTFMNMFFAAKQVNEYESTIDMGSTEALLNLD